MKIITLLLLTILVSACSSSEYIPESQVKARTFALNFRAMQFPVSVQARMDAAPRDVEYFSIVGDSALWMETPTSDPVAIPLEDLQYVTVNDRAKGMLHGILIGGGVGLISGAVAYALNPDDVRAAVIPASALVGMFVGEVAGFVVGANVHFYFGSPPAR